VRESLEESKHSHNKKQLSRERENGIENEESLGVLKCLLI
jgi:hypothetical protein